MLILTGPFVDVSRLALSPLELPVDPQLLRANRSRAILPLAESLKRLFMILLFFISELPAYNHRNSDTSS